MFTKTHLVVKAVLLAVCVSCLCLINGGAADAKQKSSVKAAFIYVAPENDMAKHRAFIDSPVVKLQVVGVKNYNEAEIVAKELVADGVTAIELCAGFGVEGTARIAKAVEGKALVGVVRFDLHPAFNHQSGDKLF
jgi:hypothetical protein